MQKIVHPRHTVKLIHRPALSEIIAQRVVALIEVSVRSGGATPAPTHTPEAILTASQAASVLCVSTKTLANWRTQGGGPRFSKAGGIKYRFCDLTTFIGDRNVASTSEARSAGGGNGC